MAKKNEQKTSPKTSETIQKAPNAPVLVHAQYLKDLSFENPNAPDSFRHNNTNPFFHLIISCLAIFIPYPLSAITRFFDLDTSIIFLIFNSLIICAPTP